MSSYQTVPDLESEVQPLVAAPPRKLGKTLVVVALFGFAAGAATATAAPHVAAKMNLASGVAWAPGIAARTGGENDSGIDIDGPPPAAKMSAPAGQTQSADGTGGDSPTVVQNDLTGGGRDAGETVIIDGRK